MRDIIEEMAILSVVTVVWAFLLLPVLIVGLLYSLIIIPISLFVGIWNKVEG